MWKLNKLSVCGLPPFKTRETISLNQTGTTVWPGNRQYGKTMILRVFEMLRQYTRVSFPFSVETTGLNFGEILRAGKKDEVELDFDVDLYDSHKDEYLMLGITFTLQKGSYTIQKVVESLQHIRGNTITQVLYKSSQGEVMTLDIHENEVESTMNPNASAMSVQPDFQDSHQLIRDTAYILRSIQTVPDLSAYKRRSLVELITNHYLRDSTEEQHTKAVKYVLENQGLNGISALSISREYGPPTISARRGQDTIPEPYIPPSILHLFAVAAAAITLPKDGLLVIDNLMARFPTRATDDLQRLLPEGGRLLLLQ